MHRVKVICASGKEHGFSLAGVETATYQTLDGARDRMLQALEDKDLGVVLIDEALSTELDPRLVSRLDQSDQPLVIPVPMRLSEGAEREYIERVLRRVIGYQVRLK